MSRYTPQVLAKGAGYDDDAVTNMPHAFAPDRWDRCTFQPPAGTPPGAALFNRRLHPTTSALLNFGTLAINTDEDLTFDISNIGLTGSVINVTNATFAGANPGLFVIDPSFSAAQLIAGGSLATETFGVNFLGSATPGTYTATLAFSTSEGTVNYDLMAVVVPEPSSLVLMAMGAFWLARRRRTLVV
jgi:hypothetical protein